MEQVFVIRPARLDDLDWFYSITKETGAGFTSLQHDKDFLRKRLTTVEKSFTEQIPVQERIYLFVRENLPTRELVGISGIDVAVGYKESFYNYQISTVTQSCKELDIYMLHTMLNVVNNFQNASELISFWVHPNFRGKNISKSLSLCRFLFIASFAEWFGKEIIAELRGVVDEAGHSPFWDAVGRNFFDMEFTRADALTMTSGKQFIADLISREPIYVDLLPEAAQEVIGVTHATTGPARYLLEAQGFKFNNHVDIFDAGPLISAERDDIWSIKHSKVATISKLQTQVPGSIQAILFNHKLDARFTVAGIQIDGTAQATISPTIAEILELQVGDKLRYVPYNQEAICKI